MLSKQFTNANDNDGHVTNIKWFVLGPFPSSMNEMDGTPPFAKSQEAKSRLPSVPNKEVLKQKFYTEFKDNGVTRWEKITQVNHKGAFLINFPDVKWQHLVQSLSSTEALQWQAWVVGEFFLSEDNTEIIVTCVGINTYWIDDRGPISADQYGNRPYKYALKLDSGRHAIKSLVRGKHQAQVQCNIKTLPNSKDNLIFSIDQNRVPDIIDSHLASTIIGITIENRSPTHTIAIQELTPNKNSITENSLYMVDTDQRFKSLHWHDILPNQVLILPVRVAMNKDIIDDNICQSKSNIPFKLNVKYSLITNKGIQEHSIKSVNVKGEFRCRFRGSSFQFTFIDVDGSVQHAAAIHPIVLESSTRIDNKIPVLIALHGTGVSASSSADSYKYKKNSSSKDYTFGIEGFWVLAPTRHGAHNWEGIGKNTAMEALHCLSKITRDMNPQADVEKVIFAGHSMGGHGAWIMAYSFPDLALAVIPQAGWTTKETYGDSNTLFLHDLQSSSVDNKLRSIIEASVQENKCESHVSNLKGIPCLARVGSNDQVVHPWWTRRMIRLLHGLHKDSDSTNLLYREIPSKEHWWWDTKKENDGGVTNDAELRSFFKRIRNNVFDGRNKYSEEWEDYDFELVVYNPSSVQSKHGFLILQQIVTYQKSTLAVSRSFEEDKLESQFKVQYVINTANVRRFQFSLDKKLQNRVKSLIIKIDTSTFYETAVSLREENVERIEFCVENEESLLWKKCNERNYKERFPLTYGPLRQVFESTFKIVYGTLGSEQMKTQYTDWALYLANTWYMTGDVTVEIVSDDYPGPINTNVLLIGDTETNKWTKRLIEENIDIVDFKLSKDSVQIGPCVFSGKVGVLSLFPIKSDSREVVRLGAVIAGTTIENMFDVVMLAKPTIPPMTRQPFSNTYPDFIVTGEGVREKGVGGFLSAGFWNYDWKYDERSSYVSYCKPKTCPETAPQNNIMSLTDVKEKIEL